MSLVEKQIREAIISAGKLNLNPEEINENKHLVYDYGLNSLSFQVLLADLEKRLKISIPEKDYQTGYFLSAAGIFLYIEKELFKK